MANYNANINITVAGASRLNAVTASVEKLNQLSQNLKPINLIAPGAGKLGDSIRQALKPVNDFARAVENGNKRISNTFAGAIGQANTFRTVLENVKVAAGGYEKQVASVKLYANALAEAEKQATRLSRAQNDLLRTSKGLQPQAVRDAEYYGRINRVQSGRFKQRQEALRLQELEDARTSGQIGRRTRIGGAVSGSIIGGAFPLLFGQGAGAAAGGAVGGLVGGLAGPGGSFAGSLLGTLLGDIASKGQQIKELGADIGFSAEQTIKLQEAFKLAGQDAEKFTAAVQNIRGLGLSIEDQADAINLVSQLTETYGGRIDKVTSAFANAVESGKVTQATLNQLTNEGITVQDALAQKYGVSRSAILQMAKDGTISVQALVDVLVNMGNTGVSETTKTKSGFDRLKTSVEALGSALAALGNALVGIFQGPFNFILESLALITKTAAESINIISDLLKFSNPTKLETTAAIQAGRMPRGGKQSVVDVIGQQRLSALEQKAGPGFLGLGTNVPKVLELLKQEPEFQATRTKIGKIEVPSQLPPSGGGGGGKSASDRAAEQAAREAARVAGVIQDQKFIAEQLEVQLRFANEIFEAEQKGDAIRVLNLKTLEQQVLAQNDIAKAVREEADPAAKLAIAAAGRVKLQAITNKGVQEVIALQAQQEKNFDTIIADLELELKLKTATTEQAREQLRLEAERAKLEEQLKGLPQPQIDQITALQAQVAAPLTDAQNIEQRIGTLKDEVAELTNIGNIAITVADGIGVAFSQAFQGLISGSMSAEEALGSFFKSVGDMFVSMAAEIIAKQMTMIILQTILKALGAVGGGGGGFAPLDNAGATNFSFNPGSMLEGPGFMPRAGGGPTAAGTPYLVGERGPELFVPGSNGGVMSNNDLRSAMNSQGSGAAGSPVLNMSFESTTIGGVEYVSRDQLEQAMAETRRAASRDGAQRGMTMTLDRIQNSSSTRRRIGV